MTEALLRGRTLSFCEEPAAVDDSGAYSYREDGAVLVRDGRIVAVGEHREIAALAAPDADVVDHRPYLLMPGLIDCHLHFPQMQVIASYGTQLLEWLRKYTFVEEQKFADDAHARRIAAHFCDTLIRHGTTTASVFCTVHRQSAAALFEEAQRRGMCLIAGKMMMDRNAPEGLTDTPERSYEESRALIEAWHGVDRLSYAVTPRFALTSTPQQLEAAGALVAEFPSCYLQTHLSENRAEIAATMALYPERTDYTEIYEHYGLTGPRSLFGHCLHLTGREVAALAESRSVAVFCPTSNLFLGSGLFDYEGLKATDPPVRIATATDIGGGTHYSMLKTMDEAYKVLQLRGQAMHPLLSFYQMTLGNARALGLEGDIGRLDPGSSADMVVLDSRSTPAMALRMETAESLAEELFVLQTMGDDRAVRQVYIAGRPAGNEEEAATTAR